MDIQAMEKRIARKAITEAIKDGNKVSVWDGEAWALRKSIKINEIIAAMFSVDEERVHFSKNDSANGWIFFVHGNGLDVMSDWSESASKYAEAGLEASDKMAYAIYG